MTDRSHCSNSIRHWFTRRGFPGVPTRTCDRCGAPNPNLEARLAAIGWDMAELDYVEAEQGWTNREPKL